MLRLGASIPETREMDLDDIFISRLRLLLIMTNAYLDGYPMGQHRRQAMLENARHVESESIDLGGLISGFPHYYQENNITEFDHVFYQRVKLLAVMIKAVAKGFPMGDLRKSAMRQNLNIICQNITFTNQPNDTKFLKVA